MVNRADAEISGFRYDRRWMLTDREGQYLSQKEIPAMALLKTTLADDGIQQQVADDVGKNDKQY